MAPSAYRSIPIRRQRGSTARKRYGIGIPQSELPRLFERFHRIEVSAAAAGRAASAWRWSRACPAAWRDHRCNRPHQPKAAISLLPSRSARRICRKGIGAEPYHGFQHDKGGSFVEALRWLRRAIAQPAWRPNADEPAPPVRCSRQCVQPPRILLADDNADMRGRPPAAARRYVVGGRRRRAALAAARANHRSGLTDDDAAT